MMMSNHMSALQKKIRPFFSPRASAMNRNTRGKRKFNKKKKLSSEPVRAASFKKLRGGVFLLRPLPHTQAYTHSK